MYFLQIAKYFKRNVSESKDWKACAIKNVARGNKWLHLWQKRSGETQIRKLIWARFSELRQNCFRTKKENLIKLQEYTSWSVFPWRTWRKLQFPKTRLKATCSKGIGSHCDKFQHTDLLIRCIQVIAFRARDIFDGVQFKILIWHLYPAFHNGAVRSKHSLASMCLQHTHYENIPM